MWKGTSRIQEVTGSSGLTERRMTLFNSVSLEFVPTSPLILTDVTMLVQSSPVPCVMRKQILLILMSSDF